MNPQQKRRQNEKSRAKYAAKQTAKGFIPLSNENTTSTSPHDTPDVGNLPGPDMIIIGSGPGFKTGDARRKAASRVMRIMPKRVEKFAVHGAHNQENDHEKAICSELSLYSQPN